MTLPISSPWWDTGTQIASLARAREPGPLPNSWRHESTGSTTVFGLANCLAKVDSRRGRGGAALALEDLEVDHVVPEAGLHSPVQHLNEVRLGDTAAQLVDEGAGSRNGSLPKSGRSRRPCNRACSSRRRGVRPRTSTGGSCHSHRYTAPRARCLSHPPSQSRPPPRI